MKLGSVPLTLSDADIRAAIVAYAEAQTGTKVSLDEVRANGVAVEDKGLEAKLFVELKLEQLTAKKTSKKGRPAKEINKQ